MRTVSKKAHLFLAAIILVLVGASSDVLAQGKGRGGEKRGGDRPAQQPQAQRPQPQAQRQQAPQRMERPQMPQMRREMPQINRQAQRPQRIERPQMPQMRREMPQINRQAQRPQRMERPQMPQMRREMPQINRQAQRPQRMERPQTQRQMPQMRDRIERKQVQPRGREERGRLARMERQLPEMSRPMGSSPKVTDERRGGRNQERQRTQAFDSRRLDSSDSLIRRGARTESTEFNALKSYSTERQVNWDRSYETDSRSFDDRERQLRQQARYEGRTFSTTGFQESVYEYNQREAWRDNIFRSVISVNLGYPVDYGFYVPPPAYVNYYDVAYDPRFYNVGYVHYDPYYSNVYVEPLSYAYQPYDAYYGSYYYNDPYYLGDPYEDYLTYQIVGSGSVGGFVTRILSNLISYGYEQGYRDGLLARQAGYVDEYYDDPYAYDIGGYDTVSYYEPYSVSTYENRRCLSEGYDLGYRDALYGEATGYVPEYRGTDLVTLWIGATYQIA